MRTALLIIDMQQGSFPPYADRFDQDGVVSRINRLADWIRRTDGVVIFIQHDGPIGDPHHPDEEGWHLLEDLRKEAGDCVVRKTACDAFLGTDLEAVLSDRHVDRLVVSGCASDYCVDTTVRTGLAKAFQVTVPSDAHTTSDKSYMNAASIIQHHNAVWADFIAPGGPASVVPTNEIIHPQ